MLTKMKLALALCGSLLVGGVGIAAAQGFNGPAAGAGPAGKADVIKKYDVNGDGKLDDTERAQLRTDMKAKHAAMKQAMLAKYDINKDGKLDDAERAAMRNERAEDAFKKADANHDGQLSVDEFKALRQHHQGRHGHGGMGGRHRGHGGKQGRGPGGPAGSDAE